MASRQVQGRTDQDTSDQLDQLATATGATRSALVARAVREFVAREAWQIQPRRQSA